MNYPFEKQTDPAGHNVTGITFDRPIPWPEFDGGGAGQDGGIGDRIATALDEGESQVEHERAEKFLGAIENAVSALDPLTDADGHLALAVNAGAETVKLLLDLQERFAQASQIISDCKPGAVAVREARAEALALLFSDKTVSLTIAALTAARGAREHAQRGSHEVSTQVRNLQNVDD